MLDPLNGIEGHFDYPGLYDRAVRDARDGSLLIEVGVFRGKSLCYLAREAKEQNKGLRVLGVDWGKGDYGTGSYKPGELIGSALANLEEHNLIRDAAVLVASSVEAAKLFPDESAEFVFLDASHDYDSVLRDLRAWLPKVKPGGTIAGHDICYGTVAAAVERVLAGRWRISPDSPSCWESMVYAESRVCPGDAVPVHSGR